MNIQKIYQQRRDDFQAKARKHSGKANRLSIARIVVFVTGVIAIIYFANARQSWSAFICLLITAIIFGWLLKRYNKITFLRNHNNFLSQINDAAIQRVQVNLKGLDTGEEFLNNTHYYANDLDVFGQNSLFQLLNHTSTASGREKLAQYLQYPFNISKIEQYQQSSQELSTDVDWVQEFIALGKHFKEEQNYNKTFFSWINAENLIKNKAVNFLVSNLLSLVAISTIIMWLLGEVSFMAFIYVAILNGIVIFTYKNKLQETTEKTDESAKALAAYELLIEKLENSSFKAEQLKQLQTQLKNEEIKASKAIKKLKDIIYLLASRGNMFYWMLNVIFMLDLRLLKIAENWKSRSKQYIEKWFDVVNEFEFINCIAAFSHAHPNYTYPVIKNEGNYFDAQHMGHPLIKPEKRVNNDFEITPENNIILVTGSNMAGKSTFLRTVGTNLVLAQLGAPVCANQFQTSPFLVFTSMRTQDNLEENISSFYAELKRIKQLLDLIPHSELTVFFMLDELLKGTNSRDRHKGAMALVQQLHNKNLTGMVSTHDLELAVMEQNLEKVVNYSFESALKDGELFFDYKIHKGVTESFNASILMHKMGIEVDTDQ